jgi:hypothetical protein
MDWTIVFYSDAFWHHAPDHYLPLRTLYDLLCTCREFRDKLPVKLAMEIMYKSTQFATAIMCNKPSTCGSCHNLVLGASTMSYSAAKHVFGLTEAMLKTRGQIPFLEAFHIAWDNNFRECMRRKSRRRNKAVVAQWAKYRSWQRGMWVHWITTHREPWHTWRIN